jgi:hypothetical protein
MTINKDIVYPIFVECCQFACDTFWENIFEDLSYGKSPYGTYISKDFLCCSYKNKEFSYKIERKDPNTMYNEIYLLLTEKLGLLSQKEKMKKKKAFKDIEDTMKDSRKTWGNIKKKNVKELMIELYVTSMKNKHHLSLKQTKHLLSVILIGMVLKVITNVDIQYEDGRIQHINGIDFAKKQVIVQRRLYKLDVNLAPHIIVEKKLMSDNWDRYIKDIKKLTSNFNL